MLSENIIISGAPRCGKSTLSKDLAEQTSCTDFPLDSLRGTSFRSKVLSIIPNQSCLFKALGGSDLKSKLEKPGGVEKHINEVFMQDEDRMKLQIDSILKKSRIVEGIDITPSMLTELIDTGRDIKGIFLIKTDEEGIKKLFSPDRREWWFDGSERDFNRQLPYITKLIQEFSNRILEDNALLGHKVIDTSINFRSSLDSAKNYLLN